MILVDSRWRGQHGIGRFAAEVLARLSNCAEVPDSIGLLNPLEPFRLAALIRRLRPAVYFSPGFNPPLGESCPLVFVIHDLIHLRFRPETTIGKRLYYEAFVKPAALRASRVLTVSEYSKAEIADWAQMDPSRIVVVGNGVSAGFAPRGRCKDLGRPYYLFVGNQKPHKNLERVVEAFGVSRLRRDAMLVITGTSSARVLGLARRHDIAASVQFTGSVTDEELGCYYRGALALVAPSLYEGFCLPALEAMACGCPVIASSSGAQSEVVGSAGLLVDPLSVESIAAAMSEVERAGVRSIHAERGIMRAGSFSWERTADIVRTALREAAAA